MVVPVVQTRIIFPEKDMPNLFGEYPTRDMDDIYIIDDPSRNSECFWNLNMIYVVMGLIIQIYHASNLN